MNYRDYLGTYRNFIRLSDKTRKYREDKKLLHYVSGLSSECGEVCSLFQKEIYTNGRVKSTKENLKSELGDILWYVTAIADYNNISLEDILEDNMNKIINRELGDENEEAFD